MPTPATAPPAQFPLPDNLEHPQPNRVFAFLASLFRIEPTPLGEVIGRNRQFGHRFRDYGKDLDVHDTKNGRTFREQYADAFGIPADLFDAPLADVVDWLKLHHPDWFQTHLGDPAQWAPNVATLMAASGMTDDEVAERLRPTADDVRAWREGRQPISATDLESLAGALRVPASVLGLPRRDALREALDTDLFDDHQQAA